MYFMGALLGHQVVWNLPFTLTSGRRARFDTSDRKVFVVFLQGHRSERRREQAHT
jgi:hypothetical protein